MSSKDTVEVITSINRYQVHIGHDLLRTIPNIIFESCPKVSKIFLLTDANVARYHAVPILSELNDYIVSNRLQVQVILKIIPAGEQSKTRRVKEEVEDEMVQGGCGRDCVLLALGGGVVCDLGGFVASTYMRGIPYIMIATSLLSMVDASVGGKTAVDTAQTKNLVGSFYPPAAVIIDLAFLCTLPHRHISNGLAEVIKVAVTLDSQLFQHLVDELYYVMDWYTPARETATRNQGSLDPTFERAMHVLYKCIVQSVKIKAQVVSVDEKEMHLRSVLNFGHSIGHALESLTQPDLLHGECVSVGMVLEASVSANYQADHSPSNGTFASVIHELTSLLKQAGLPTELPRHIAPEDLVSAMSNDKKNLAGSKRLVMLSVLGSVAVTPISSTSTHSQFTPFSLKDISSPSNALTSLAFTHPVSDPLLYSTIAPFGSYQITPLPHTASTMETTSFDLSSPSHAIPEIRVPGSKSLSNRALLLAALVSSFNTPSCPSNPTSTTLTGFLRSDDTDVVISAIKSLGATVIWHSPTCLSVTPPQDGFTFCEKPLFVGNAGTAARFLLAGLASAKWANAQISSANPLEKGPMDYFCLYGDERMNKRPMAELINALADQGVEIISAKNLSLDKSEIKEQSASSAMCPTALPVLVKPRRLRGGKIIIDGSESSQFVSALLMAAPLAETNVELVVNNSSSMRQSEDGKPATLVSKTYIDMTIQLMQVFGASVSACPNNPGTYYIKNTGYRSPNIFAIEGDASSATYPMALSAINGVRVATNVGCYAPFIHMDLTTENNLSSPLSTSMQGDALFPLFLTLMGCSTMYKTCSNQNRSSAHQPPADTKLLIQGPSPTPIRRITCSNCDGTRPSDHDPSSLKCTRMCGLVVINESASSSLPLSSYDHLSSSTVGKRAWQQLAADIAALSSAYPALKSESDKVKLVLRRKPLPFLIGLGEIDLADATDSFLALSVVAALARGPTTIRNISNQRVKECDRIAAVIKGLRHAGILCMELDDGLRIEGLLTESEVKDLVTSSPDLLACEDSATYGTPSEITSSSSETASRDGYKVSARPRTASSKQLALIKCYNDHRVVMSFAVLSTRLDHVVIMDKTCVSKTYPAFFLDMRALNMRARAISRYAIIPPPPLNNVFKRTGSTIWAKWASDYLASTSHPSDKATITSCSSGEEEAYWLGGPKAIARPLEDDALQMLINKYTYKQTMCPKSVDDDKAPLNTDVSVLRPHSSRVSHRSIVLIGMRGVGKSTCGEHLALELGSLFFDMDTVIAATPDVKEAGGISKFVSSHGWKRFREIEAKAFTNTIIQHPRGAVIACGGGIIETPQILDAMSQWSRRIRSCEGYNLGLGVHPDDVAGLPDHTSLTFDVAGTSPPSILPLSLGSVNPAPLVIHLLKAEQDIEATLAANPSRPSLQLGGSHFTPVSPPKGIEVLSEHIQIFRARLPVYRQASVTEILLKPSTLTQPQKPSWDSSVREKCDEPWSAQTVQWLRRASAWINTIGGSLTSHIVQPPILRDNTFFLSVTVGNLCKTGTASPSDSADSKSVPTDGPISPSKDEQRCEDEIQDRLYGNARVTPSEPVSSGPLKKRVGPSSPVTDVSFDLAKASEYVDAIELRADCMDVLPPSFLDCNLSCDSKAPSACANPEDIDALLNHIDEESAKAIGFLHTQLQYAKEHRPDLPVIYTLRTTSQGGKFVCSEYGYEKALTLAMRLGFEYIDIESCWSLSARIRLARLATALHVKIISSYHIPGSPSSCSTLPGLGIQHSPTRTEGLDVGTSSEYDVLRRLAIKCANIGGWPIDIVKVVTASRADCDPLAVVTAVTDVIPKHYYATHCKDNRTPPSFPELPITDPYNINRLSAQILSEVSSKSATRAKRSQVSSSALPIATDPVPFKVLPPPGTIALATETSGTPTRLACFTLCPVTSPLLPFPAAPGQLTASAILQCRQAMGLIRPSRYFIFGSPVTYSPSPPMHLAVYQQYGLPWRFDRAEVKTVEELCSVIAACGKDFGGGCVTIPMKEKVIPILTAMDPAAKAMGAVNTIIAVPDHLLPPTSSISSTLRYSSLPVLLGYNTDWIGVAEPIANALAKLSSQSRTHQHVCTPFTQTGTQCTDSGFIAGRGVAIVVGAGGTARAALFALKQLGFKGNRLIVYNRDVDRGNALAAEFGCSHVSNIIVKPDDPVSFKSSGGDRDNPSVVALTLKLVRDICGDKDALVEVLVSTVPGAAGFYVPDCIIRQLDKSSSEGKDTSGNASTVKLPVVMDVAYLPKRSSVLEHAKKAGLITLSGIDMLLAQGRAQSRLWTGKLAGYQTLSDVANRFYDALDLP